MLWDLIRDFFVQHVFGGTYYTSEGDLEYATSYLGYDSNADADINVSNVLVNTGLKYVDGTSISLTMGDWLSTTATAISITIIVVLCCLFVYKIIKLIGGLIR